MPFRAPEFWWTGAGWRASALSPLAAIYGAIAARRMANAPRVKAPLPVLCVGNLTVGGSGKTPVAIALALAARTMGLTPGFLSRGYGARTGRPRIVDPHLDNAKLVGDEPLLLAAHAPVAVTPDREAGARLLAAHGCNFIVMDDGFQSARIHMDLALLVVDARYGIGNGRVFPAGPLRAPLADQLRLADAVLRIGEGDRADLVLRTVGTVGKPVFAAGIEVKSPEQYKGKRFLAFAGIGHPEKFFDTVRSAGGVVAVARAFPDHHAYRESDLDSLLAAAGGDGLRIVTTTKDAARLKGVSGSRKLLQMLETLDIEVAFDPHDTSERIIRDTLAAWEKRREAR